MRCFLLLLYAKTASQALNGVISICNKQFNKLGVVLVVLLFSSRMPNIHTYVCERIWGCGNLRCEDLRLWK